MPGMMFVMMMFVAGMAVALQPSINSRLAERVGIVESACISFAVGTATLLILSLVMGRGSFRGAGHAPWWEWTGGILGAFFVSMTIVVVPRIGTAAAMAVTIAAQLLTGLLLDHFAVLGLRGTPLDLKRMGGAILLMAGALLIAKR